MPSDWNPPQYLRYSNERIRAAVDLLERVDLEAPEVVYDLGCGTGNTTALLKQRWLAAQITGVDSSPAMLQQAEADQGAAGSGLRWQHADLANWAPDTPADLLYSNAAFQWVDQHEKIFPRLLRAVKPGGVLAVQMPNFFGSPRHTALLETVHAGGWYKRLQPYLREHPVGELSEYYDLLSPGTDSLDMWETTYMHILEGDNPVLEWTKGTLLPPLLGQLSESEGKTFVEDYSQRVAAAYPRRADGKTVLPFRRVFMIAVKR